MNAEREYFGKLYSNKGAWSTYTKRELDIIKSTFDGLLESLKAPFTDERVAKTYRISPDEVAYLRVHGLDVKQELDSMKGTFDPKEFSRIKSKLLDNIEDILIAKQDGEEPKAICAYYNLPYDRKAWVAVQHKEQRASGLNIDSAKDVNYVIDAFEAGESVTDLFIRQTGLFRDRLDLYDAIERNGYDLEDYIGLEKYNDYLRMEDRPVKGDTEKLVVL